MSENEISSTTQAFLDVYDITNDMVLLKDGTASMILQIGTMNFSLLAEQEQDAVIYTYGSLLNSLNFPVQINIQSQTKDATKYLQLLDEQAQKATSERKAALIKKYQSFVSQLIKERNVLEKKFYAVIPVSPGEMGLIAPKNVLPGQTQFDIRSVEKSMLLEKAITILEPRRDHLVSQFARLGLFAQQLTTQEIIRNFYINYNPEAAEGQEIGNSNAYTTPMVRASYSKNLMASIQANTNPTYQAKQEKINSYTVQESNYMTDTAQPNNLDQGTELNQPEAVVSEPINVAAEAPEAPAEVTTESAASNVPPIDDIPENTVGNLSIDPSLATPAMSAPETAAPADTTTTNLKPNINQPAEVEGISLSNQAQPNIPNVNSAAFNPGVNSMDLSATPNTLPNTAPGTAAPAAVQVDFSEEIKPLTPQESAEAKQPPIVPRSSTPTTPPNIEATPAAESAPLTTPANPTGPNNTPVEPSAPPTVERADAPSSTPGSTEPIVPSVTNPTAETTEEAAEATPPAPAEL